MSDIPLHLTPMGRKFFEHTVPELVRELARLNTNLERIAAETERAPERDDAPPPVDPKRT